MKERIEIRLNKKSYDQIEKIRIEKGFEDKQDYIINLLEKEIKKENNFINKLKQLFN